MSNLMRLFICIMTLGIFLYVYVDKLNAQTELRIQIPTLAKEVDQINQDIVHLCYEMECFKNPMHLMQLAKQPEYSHLKFPYVEDILVVGSGLAQQVQMENAEQIHEVNKTLKLPILLGTK